MNAGEPHPRIQILGGEIDLITPCEMMRFVDIVAGAGGTALVANHNLHSLALLQNSPELRAFFDDADLIQLDSMPVAAWAKLLRLPLSSQHRSTYLDWRDEFWRLANERKWRVFYLGGAPGVAEQACSNLAERWPHITFGFRDGYFDADAASIDNRGVLAKIEAFEADILFVGMGMPRQELWISQNRAAIRRGVIFSVGAAFDYEAGVQAAAPRWMGRVGLEWLFRLASQPRRLAHRYLVEPWRLLGPALRDVRAAHSTRHVRSFRKPAVDRGPVWPLSSAN
ncbi:MAG: WecB/TagA/CpsF family glycosyltransferase [Proteobacteria bacterium]|nr:WecB/TagA/CpsF family glycosyltransferase [Pseudomonadota bacterium]